jgi:mono/diheme cytochrome c family protein
VYVADSVKGRVWRIFYTGEQKKVAAAPAPAVTDPAQEARGAQLYQQACAACHMADGAGVSGMMPAVAGSAVVSGDPETLVKLIVSGADAALPRSRPAYANRMPAFSGWPDPDVAAVLTYMRRAFGGVAPPVTAAQVAVMRGAP